MARIRSIKPEFWTSEQVMECSLSARLLFIGLWNFADDLGRLPMSAKSIKAMVFPSDDLGLETILGMLQELAENGLILPYVVDDREYLQITGWQHQRIDKPQPGKHPAPVGEYSKSIRGAVATDRKGEERRGEEKNSEPIGSGAEAPSDPRKRLFTEGLATVRRLTGRGEDSARALIGKWLGQASDEATVVLGLIDDADRNQVANLTSWIVPRLKEQRQIGEPINVDWDAQVARFKRGIGWSAKWYGPEPGQYGCRAPPDVLEKYGYRRTDGAIA